MNERKICFDRATLDNKIILDDDNYLVMPAVIASEIVHQYKEGWAYKPASELEKAAWTADHRWVKILSHPETALLQTTSDIYGIVENPQYVKNLMDPKTKRPMRKGIRADIKWFKDKVPEPVIEQIKNGELRAVSIGFTYEEDLTPGEWNGQKYDFVQRNIFIDHVAAPIEEGRCPGPLCGIAVDSVIRKVASDPFAGYANFEDCVAKNQDKNNPEAYCAEIKRKTEGQDRTILGILNRDLSVEQKAALDKCPVCREIVNVGLLESAKRLSIAYGKDVLYVIKGEEPSKPEETEDLLLEAKKTIDSARWFFED